MEQLPTLYTKRLRLRQMRHEDIPFLVKYANNKKIADQIVNIPFPYREFDAAMRLPTILRGFKQKTHFAFAVTLKETDHLIGEISLLQMDKTQKHAQLAYWIGEPYWNQGIITEAIPAILKFGFEMLDRDLIYADCFESNPASARVLQKNGMQYHTRNGNILLFRITKEEFLT